MATPCLLSGEAIKSNGVVEGATEEHFRATTYDLSIQHIVPAGGKTWKNASYSLAPGGMVRVVSKESLRMPPTISGYALLKNELCTVGVLALSIGIIDPGFHGPISSTLINFGRAPVDIAQGDAFLRVSFLTCVASAKVTSVDLTPEKYLDKVREDVRAYSGPGFLNIQEVAVKAADKAFAAFKNSVLAWAAGFGLILAILAMFAPLGASAVQNYLSARDEQKMEQTVEQNIKTSYEQQLKTLSDQLQALQQQSAARQGKPNVRSTNQ